ncbi:phage head closure protein [Desulfosporosinus sp. SB140]|uniref:phage head closure protein n=1 Tax=Desulfosporosinus paludis TaxID=3115649 RepID=UPI00388D679A
MRNKINILTWGDGENEAGDTILVPSIYKTVYASIKPIRGKDSFEAKKYQAQLTHKITIRYLSGLTPDMQIQYQDRIFLIDDIINIMERNVFLEIMALERVAKNG